MKTKTYFTIISILLFINNSHAQKIIYSGKITYDRKENLHAQMSQFGEDNSWVDNMKKTIPKYKITRFEMLFNLTESLYAKATEQPAGQTKGGAMGFIGADKPENIVYKNTTTQKLQTQMNVFDKNFLLQDSLPKYQWKLTNEYRNINGYNCRKATAITMDSLYVIAFYTDAIYCSTGPLGTNGLPGAILGLVIPRFNTTYFATKIESISIPDGEIVASTKGEKINSKALAEKIAEASKGWGNGKYTKNIVWGALL